MTLTLRNLPTSVEKAIKEKAARDRTSPCRAAVPLLERAVVGRTSPEVHHDLDHLADSWSRKDARAFERALGRQRTIDKELWQ